MTLEKYGLVSVEPHIGQDMAAGYVMGAIAWIGVEVDRNLEKIFYDISISYLSWS